jgi:hypothetical protein
VIFRLAWNSGAAANAGVVQTQVRVERDAADKTKRVETRFISDDPRDLNGPPYGVAENVFDEYDVEVCTLKPGNKGE